MNEKVLLVGTGSMGSAYAHVLKALNIGTIVVGNTAEGCSRFSAATGLPARAGGVQRFLESGYALPSHAIVCTPIESSASCVLALVAAGLSRLLVEKPGGATSGELIALDASIRRSRSTVFIAYNRRFYASVLEVLSRIFTEGGVESFHFEFTERESDANPNKFSARVLENWGLANSSHVIDLAFHIGGRPTSIASEIAGSTDWHSRGSHFAGCGRTDKGALFSYCANWCSGGRWSVEVMTRESRLILRPLEKLFVQRRGSFSIAEAALEDTIDQRFKPGLYRQTEAFLSGTEDFAFVTLAEQARRAAAEFAVITGEAPGP